MPQTLLSFGREGICYSIRSQDLIHDIDKVALAKCVILVIWSHENWHTSQQILLQMRGISDRQVCAWIYGSKFARSPHIPCGLKICFHMQIPIDPINEIQPIQAMWILSMIKILADGNQPFSSHSPPTAAWSGVTAAFLYPRGLTKEMKSLCTWRYLHPPAFVASFHHKRNNWQGEKREKSYPAHEKERGKNERSLVNTITVKLISHLERWALTARISDSVQGQMMAKIVNPDWKKALWFGGSEGYYLIYAVSFKEQKLIVSIPWSIFVTQGGFGRNWILLLTAE